MLPDLVCELNTGKDDGGIHEEFESEHAGASVAEPEDVAGVIVSLTDPANGWINAQTIEVSGGFMI